MKVIELENLTRHFKVAKREGSFLAYMFHRRYTTVEAVKGISFSIEAGELVGFIGPNGAGKSTTIKMMAGILVPTSGKLTVLGRVPHQHRKANAAGIGVLFGQRSQLWWDLPVSDTFKLLKKIYKIPDEVFTQNVESYGRILGIQAFMHQPVRQLSLGQRMRADLCASLLHNPKIVFLDEPTIGLEVVGKKQIREMIRSINAEKGITVILTTHDMKDIEEICNRIIMIDKGQIIIDAPMKDVKSQFKGSNTITVVFDAPPDSLDIQGAQDIQLQDHGKAVISYNPAVITSAEIVSALVSKYTIVDISMKEAEIDDIIRNLYENHG
jgi:ABC-2 type transport system ATP-binding protein